MSKVIFLFLFMSIISKCYCQNNEFGVSVTSIYVVDEKMDLPYKRYMHLSYFSGISFKHHFTKFSGLANYSSFKVFYTKFESPDSYTWHKYVLNTLKTGIGKRWKKGRFSFLLAGKLSFISSYLYSEEKKGFDEVNRFWKNSWGIGLNPALCLDYSLCDFISVAVDTGGDIAWFHNRYNGETIQSFQPIPVNQTKSKNSVLVLFFQPLATCSLLIHF